MHNYEIVGIVICLMHSAMFSGLNLGFFGISRLRLEIQAEAGDKDAQRILYLRKDAHLLLATILWANVSSNVLLTIFTDSFLTGTLAFIVSTVAITLFGEITPQAYFSKNALRMSKFLYPFVRFYQIVLFVIAKPTALLLDHWLGKEQIVYFQEKEFIVLLRRHASERVSDVERMESLGALNFLELDDVRVDHEGEIINPASIIQLPEDNGRPVFPEMTRGFDDPFLQKINFSREKWVVITNSSNEPLLVLDTDQFLRDAIYGKDALNIYFYCHRPIVVRVAGTKLGDVLFQLKVQAEHAEDDVIDHDIILFWGQQKRIITGADILGRLFRGIAKSDRQIKSNLEKP
jgi:hypothetical protein